MELIGRKEFKMSYQLELETSFGEDNEIRVIVDVTPGRPAKINCLPEDAYPEESDEIEIVDCWLIKRHEVGTNEEVPFYFEGVATWHEGLKKYISLEEMISEEAIEKFHEE